MSQFYEAREILQLSLGLEEYTESQQRVATSLLDSMGGFMDRWTGRVLESTTHTRERYQQRYIEGDYLTLNNYPVTTLTAIYANDDTTAITSGNYKLMDENAGIIYKESGWSDATYYYEATYTAGYSVASYPKEWAHLSWIQAELCSILWHRGEKITYSSDNWNFDNLESTDNSFRLILQEHLALYKRRTSGMPL